MLPLSSPYAVDIACRRFLHLRARRVVRYLTSQALSTPCRLVWCRRGVGLCLVRKSQPSGSHRLAFFGHFEELFALGDLVGLHVVSAGARRSCVTGVGVACIRRRHDRTTLVVAAGVSRRMSCG